MRNQKLTITEKRYFIKAVNEAKEGFIYKIKNANTKYFNYSKEIPRLLKEGKIVLASVSTLTSKSSVSIEDFIKGGVSTKARFEKKFEKENHAKYGQKNIDQKFIAEEAKKFCDSLMMNKITSVEQYTKELNKFSDACNSLVKKWN